MPDRLTGLLDDYKVSDNSVTATFTHRAVAGNTSLTITNADYADLTQKEVLASQGMYGMGDRSWSLGANQITTGNEPAPGDEIVDPQGVKWEVIDAVLDGFSISWECTTRKAR